jgi:hypothetical protein
MMCCPQVFVAVAAFVVVAAVGALNYRTFFVIFDHVGTSGRHCSSLGMAQILKVLIIPRWLKERYFFPLKHTEESFYTLWPNGSWWL